MTSVVWNEDVVAEVEWDVVEVAFEDVGTVVAEVAEEVCVVVVLCTEDAATDVEACDDAAALVDTFATVDEDADTTLAFTELTTEFTAFAVLVGASHTGAAVATLGNALLA